MASKTPFEIRSDLLNLALTICSERTNAERQKLEQDWHSIREMCISASGSKIIPDYPKIPFVTSEEVISEAKKLNDFVSNG